MIPSPPPRHRLPHSPAPVSWQDEPGTPDRPPGPGFWAVTRHADALRVLQDPATYSSLPGPGELPLLRRLLSHQDPPQHTRLREHAAGALTAERVQRFTATAHERARALLTRALDTARATDGVLDLATAVSAPYTALNLADLLGVPHADRRRLPGWTGPHALEDMTGYAPHLIVHRRRYPDDDLTTVLAHNARLTSDELEMLVPLLLTTGLAPMRDAAAGGLALLAEHPEAYRELRDGSAELGSATEELLRLHPPLLTIRRTAATDTELSGRRVRRGDQVVVFLATAHHDDQVFTAPGRLDLARTPNPHLSLGAGPHLCLGADFARLQLRVLYEEVLRALPELRLAGPVPASGSGVTDEVASLPVRAG
ncbi:cytochrome P450 [Streptomyces sp. SID2999]|uniref:cytochrome P450 n=1 Tax=Streptomyces sp. SID2999 TaxID=2690258 RepID=UPI0013696980|nr:cytochrome P450 [Streptomyces sp. SID2999]MYZ10018.1 cytochrome P450 [Streptomyces sp. SID2999]